MYNYEKYLLAYIICDKLDEELDYGSSKRTLIHLLCTLKNENLEEDLQINDQNNIKIYHAARAAKSKYGLQCVSGVKLNNQNNIISINYSLIRRETQLPRVLEINEIPEILDNNKTLSNRGLNTTEQERAGLFENIISLCIQTEVPPRFEADVHPKFEALHSLLATIRDNEEIAHDIINGNNPDARQRFLQTVIGAAIFYLPVSANDHWDGKISFEALKNKVFNGRVTKDHILPRRLGAQSLMNQYVNNDINSAADLADYYDRHLAVYTYVTPEENKRLVNYFLEHDNYGDAQLANGILSFPQEEENSFESNAQLKQFSAYLNTEIKRESDFTIENVNTLFINGDWR